MENRGRRPEIWERSHTQGSCNVVQMDLMRERCSGLWGRSSGVAEVVPDYWSSPRDQAARDSIVKGQYLRTEGGDGGAARHERSPRGMKQEAPDMVRRACCPRLVSDARPRGALPAPVPSLLSPLPPPPKDGARAIPATDGAGACLRDMESYPPSQARWAGSAGR